MKLIYRVRVPIHTYIGTSGAREREEEWNCVRQWCPPPRVESNWIHNLLLTIDKSMWFHELFNTATRLNFIVSFNFPMTYRSWRPWQKTLSINKFIIAVAESYWMVGWVGYIYISQQLHAIWYKTGKWTRFSTPFKWMSWLVLCNSCTTSVVLIINNSICVLLSPELFGWFSPFV